MCGIWALFGIDCPECDRFGAFQKICHRGPDSWRMESVPGFMNVIMAFHRLAINGPIFGMQPMRLHAFPHLWLCCNGEIYNNEKLAVEKGYQYETDCDVECIAHLYNEGGIEYCCSQLDGVFAFVLLDTEKKQLFLARDTFGVRPLFKLLTEDSGLVICSEAKGLVSLRKKGELEISQHMPGTVDVFDITATTGKVKLQNSIKFHNIGLPQKYLTEVSSLDNDVLKNIRTLFTASVKKRMMSSRRMGALLSGGLDSSLVAATLAKLSKEVGIPYKIQTFSIGVPGSPDVMAARKVAEHIGSEHIEVLLTEEDILNVLKDTIYTIESYDTTTIRASLPMYLISKYIKTETETVVLFSGEGSDELAQGYLYFHDAPTVENGHEESMRLLTDLCYFDVLRSDRTTAAHGLEVRVPFLDHQFTSYYLSLAPELRRPKNGIEKYLLRKAFDGTDLLPGDILWRQKEAFSDGVSSQKRSLFTIIQENADKQVDDSLMETKDQQFPVNTPQTKEMMNSRIIFDSFFNKMQHFVPYFWMPKWNDNITDPSARFLSQYGKDEDN